MNTAPIKANILYVGDLADGGTCVQRMHALRDLGCSVTAINTRRPMSSLGTLYLRARHKLFGVFDTNNANRAIVEHISAEPFDVLWLDKALTIAPETLAAVRAVRPDSRIIGYSPDDMAAPHNQSKQFLDHIKYYDIYFTTKSIGVGELTELGCPAVSFIGNAYDLHTHRPVTVSDSDRKRLGGLVGFIGTWEDDRATSMLSVARAGVAVRIWGSDWHRQSERHERMQIEGQAVNGDEYARAICSFDINLAFLRKINRDKQTTRSIEVPACGGFMLAERTDEHMALFEEGREAEYFSSNSELIDKIKFYLQNAATRKKIAAAGRERCLKSGYSYHERLRSMLGTILSGVHK